MDSSIMYIYMLLVINIGIGMSANLPIIVSTWLNSENATRKAYEVLTTGGGDRLDALEQGINVCDLENRCGFGTGAHSTVDDTGEVTQDAMMMDGEDMSVGAVGCLREVKNAIGVARAVMKYTKTTFLVGSSATEFATSMGFPTENISMGAALDSYSDWRENNCQPNFWRQDMVSPNSSTSCGPYQPITLSSRRKRDVTSQLADAPPVVTLDNHDTVGMVVVDADGATAAGCSTNGLRFKIHGRVGDSPIAGAGSYAEQGVGAAAATGNGDVMMRMLPTFHTVMLMAQGYSTGEAAALAVSRIRKYYPTAGGAVLAVRVNGEHGAACFGMTTFTYMVRSGDMADVQPFTVPCLTYQVTPSPEPSPEPSDAPMSVTSVTRKTALLTLCWCIKHFVQRIDY